MLDTKQVMQPEEAWALLRAWFNNKMMVIVFKVRAPQIYLRKEKMDSQESIIFLKDLQRHFLTRLALDSKISMRAARWLIVFFKIYPRNLSPKRLDKAWDQLRLVYTGFGVEFPLDKEKSAA